MQELGYQVWAVAEGEVITLEDVDDAKDAYEAKLDSSFFRVRLDRATQLQIACMRAMAQLGPESQKAADVAAVMGRESTQLAPTRSELINMGLLYTPSHGYAGFTVPHFDRFMLRAVPELDVPPVQKRRSRGKTYEATGGRQQKQTTRRRHGVSVQLNVPAGAGTHWRYRGGAQRREASSAVVLPFLRAGAPL
ncbi:hypothetical protein [Arthrobacter sp. SLBN-100]|uniref:hypothetical protein n=1 Tax=Arthrobacter sp. SLBN-100 TaxID=2768450 RepID=UPI00190F28CE|nr:hypothetical protein [Arthrobacter sp. SLBN-100]